MIFHIHFSISESSGEIRRIRNIHNEFVCHSNEDVIEICFTSPLLLLRKSKFKLSKNVIKKYYLPRLPFSFSNGFFKSVNGIWESFLVWLLSWHYKPHSVFAEYLLGGEATQFLSKNVNVILDVHGANVEEYIYSERKPKKSYISVLNRLERIGLKQAKKVICQSLEMKNYLLRKHDFMDAERIHIYRCTADNNVFRYSEESRIEIRKCLNVPNNALLLVYSGGMMKWQKVDDTLSYFKILRSYYNDLYLLILTGSVQEANNKIEKICPEISDNIMVTSTNYNNVYKYLSASDAGFLLRDNVVMNSVAFPTKLAEYMMCGLAVISGNVADKWVNDTTFIFNVEKQSDKCCVDFIKHCDKKNIIEFANNNLSLTQDKREVKRFFDEI